MVLESALESADSSPESAYSTIDFMIVGGLPLLNTFNIYMPIWSVDKNPLTIGLLLLKGHTH